MAAGRTYGAVHMMSDRTSMTNDSITGGDEVAKSRQSGCHAHVLEEYVLYYKLHVYPMYYILYYSIVLWKHVYIDGISVS